MGKTSIYKNTCKELSCAFSRLGNKLEVIFRAYDDGFAYRYQITPEQGGAVTVSAETSQVVIDRHAYSWIQKYHKSYEAHYDKRDWASILSVGGDNHFGAPVLTQNADGLYFLITEAANYGTYATSKLIANQPEGSYSFAPVGEVQSASPLLTPWRAVILGSLNTVVESVMVENLNPPTAIEDVSWIKPGRTSWDWGGEDAQNTVGLDIAMKYINYSSEMDWEYFLLDDGWSGSKADYTLNQITDSVKAKSVGLFVWTNQNRFQNDKAQIRQVLQPWKDLGVVGFKADFFEDDSQVMMQKYDKILEVAADLKMMVNLHGSTKPSGIRRKWPNLLTSEGVFGNEVYWDWPHTCPPKHVINLTLTRNVIGAMDYTPGKFATKTGKILTNGSWSQQLALLVAFESGLQCITDNPRNFRNQIFESYLKRIPVAWDETRCLEALPDSYVTLARRKGDDWYVASLCDESRQFSLTLDFVKRDTPYYAYIYKNGDCLSEVQFEYLNNLTYGDKIEIPMLKGGGVTVHLSTNPDLLKPVVKKYEAEAKENKSYGDKTIDADGLCSGNMYLSKLGKGIYLRFQEITADKPGKYAMQVYYMDSEDRNMYVKVNNEAELIFPFGRTKGTSGSFLGFQTIIVDLNEGKNTIELGNRSETIPNIDRITLMYIGDAGSSGMNKTACQSFQITGFENQINISSTEDGHACVYSMDGRLLLQQEIRRGNTQINIPRRGIYIVNVKTENESVSQKVVL